MHRAVDLYSIISMHRRWWFRYP